MDKQLSETEGLGVEEPAVGEFEFRYDGQRHEGEGHEGGGEAGAYVVGNAVEAAVLLRHLLAAKVRHKPCHGQGEAMSISLSIVDGDATSAPYEAVGGRDHTVVVAAHHDEVVGVLMAVKMRRRRNVLLTYYLKK